MNLQDWAQQTAASIMTTDLVTLAPGQTIAEAGRILLHEQISGAPVVDDKGKCVGVFSVTDIPLAEQKLEVLQKEMAHTAFWNSDLVHPLDLFQEHPISLENYSVSSFMTRDLVAVTPRTPLSAVIHHLVEAHIHRVLVVDAEGRLQGIVSTQDILAAMLNALPVA